MTEPKKPEPVVRAFAGPDLGDLFERSIAAEFIARSLAEDGGEALAVDEGRKKPETTALQPQS